MTQRNAEVQRLLDHVESVAGVRRALLVTADGLPRYWSGVPLAPEADEHMAATIAPLGHLARNVAQAHGGAAWQRLVIDMPLEDGIGRFVVAPVGARAYLAVSARPGMKLTALSCAVADLVQRVGELLDAAARPAEPRGKGG